MPGSMDRQPDRQGDGQMDDEEEYMEEINPDDILEIIDLPDEPPGEDDMADEMEDMALQQQEDGEDGAVATEMRDDATTVFTKHTGSVFCCDLDPKTGALAITGGEDDKAYVWRTDSGDVVLECTGHSDSVTAATFSHDGVYVATGDMEGNIKVWDIEGKQEIWSYSLGMDLEWMEWHHGAHVLLAGVSSGDVWMWKVPSGDCRTFVSPAGSEASVGQVTPDGKRAVVGYGDGVIKVWDLKDGQAIQTLSAQNGHTSAVTCIDCHTDNTLVISGSTDLTAKILTTANRGKVVATFDCSSTPQDTKTEDSVEAVGFSKTTHLCATGTLAGVLCIWDTKTQSCRHQCQHEAGITRLKWDTSAPFVYTATLDGAVSLWDARSGKRESQWFGHQGEILDMAVSRDSQYLVTTSEDHTARVYTINNVDR